MTIDSLLLAELKAANYSGALNSPAWLEKPIYIQVGGLHGWRSHTSGYRAGQMAVTLGHDCTYVFGYIMWLFGWALRRRSVVVRHVCSACQGVQLSVQVLDDWSWLKGPNANAVAAWAPNSPSLLDKSSCCDKHQHYEQSAQSCRMQAPVTSNIQLTTDAKSTLRN